MDICFVSETHLKPEQKFEVSPFITVNNAYTGHSKKPRGGISCIVRASCKQFVSKIDKSQDDVITVTLVGGHRVTSNYIPPVDSCYFKDTMFRIIANEYEPECKEKVVLTGGDINSRVGNLIQPP